MFTQLWLGLTRSRKQPYSFSLEEGLQVIQIPNPAFLNLYSVNRGPHWRGSITKYIEGNSLSEYNEHNIKEKSTLSWFNSVSSLYRPQNPVESILKRSPPLS